MLCSWSGWPVSRLARPRTQHDSHHDTKVQPEAATAVIELLVMGGKTPETRWAVNERQDNKLENCCIWLIYFNCTMMHELTNLKFKPGNLQHKCQKLNNDIHFCCSKTEVNKALLSFVKTFVTQFAVWALFCTREVNPSLQTAGFMEGYRGRFL